MWMQSDTVLEVEHLSKLYSRTQNATRKRLANTFGRTLLGRSPKPPTDLEIGEFWSLKNVSFSLRRGEALGVIGFNGAGKTTLLRLLAGQLLPDKGEIRIAGNSAAMIDLTAGFQMMTTGRRNIFLRGAMLGRSKEEITVTYDKIIDFAELGSAIDAPVSTYSSGMLMRLAFSIMVVAKPDLLFIDEVLAVGDFRFKQKCLARIRELREQSAILFVSHSMTDVSRFCERVMVLNNGELIFLGDPEKAIELYHSLNPANKKALSEGPKSIIPESLSNERLIDDVKHYWCDKNGQAIEEIYAGEPIYFCCTFKILYEPKHLVVGVPVYDMGGELITGFSTDIEGLKIEISANGCCELVMTVDNVCLNPGSYQSAIGIVDGVEFLYIEENIKLTVLSSGRLHWGDVTLPHKWEVVKNTNVKRGS